jgi:hypothetical protein
MLNFVALAQCGIPYAGRRRKAIVSHFTRSRWQYRLADVEACHFEKDRFIDLFMVEIGAFFMSRSLYHDSVTH